MSRGNLRIYLGAAPGVGKTFAMLNEGWRRAGRGTDVVVGYIETHGRANTAAQIRDLEVVPRQTVNYRGTEFEEMDVEAILARRPKVVLVDELAHTNVPGVKHAKRYEDVADLLDAGIDVISTVNIQHLESVNDVVEDITGVKQRETVPDEVVRAADQIELVDMSPEALRRRMAHGNIYAPEKVDAALAHYFRVGNLGALRELALLWVADRVDAGLKDYRMLHGIDKPWETRERVVVAVTGAPSGEHLIRRAARMAQRSKAELLGVHIRASDGLADAPSDLLERHRQLLVDLGGAYHEVVGADVGKALLEFAKAENATQIVLGATRRTRWRELFQGSVINAVVRDSGPIDVHVISHETSEDHGVRLIKRRRLPSLSARRQIYGWLLATIGIPLLTLLLAQTRSHLNLPAEMLLYLLLVSAVAATGGLWPALVAAVASSLAVNYFFTPPIHTFTINEFQNVVAVAVFVAVAALVSALVSQTSRRTADAERARAEAEALARVAGGLVGEADPLDGLVAHLRSTFDLDAVAVLVPDGGSGWLVEAAAGAPVPGSPEGQEALGLVGDAQLVLAGSGLRADDRRVLLAFVAQLNRALEHRELQTEAADAAALAEADHLRTAILRAVSHDLRTPLASIKASVTSLLSDDVAWTLDDREEFLTTIDEETDRLNLLVGNLLDMSRLESGAVQVLLRPVGLEEVVPQALASISGATDRVKVELSETLPRVMADPALLERAVANVTANALRHSPPDHHVRVEAGAVEDRVDLRVIDRGPGVDPAERDKVFEPFQRLGDRSTDTGVGLGLAVSRGFVDAMGGELFLEDTPGGGLTTVISMKQSG